MTKNHISYPSADGKSKIHAIEWLPEGEPRAILQIVHGMIEYIDRYDEFARLLADNGYIVVGEDHLGHGDTVEDEKDFGYFGRGGNALVIKDIAKLREITQSKYPDLPYLMLGHSMGSFLTRQYIVTGDEHIYAEGLSGVVIMGTGWQPGIALKAGRAITGVLGMVRGEHHRSMLVKALAFGSYNKKIKKHRTQKDWLTTDDDVVDANLKDPRSNYEFTVNGYYNMFKGIEKAQDIERISRLPEGLRILFVSGADDPVGSYGEGVRKAFMEYHENTKCEVDIQLYEGMRHEVINEVGREEVHQDILAWLNSCIE